MTQCLSATLQDKEALNDFRSEMAQIHQEISELKLMVENCMEWQGKLQQSIKQDILDAINQSGYANYRS